MMALTKTDKNGKGCQRRSSAPSVFVLATILHSISVSFGQYQLKMMSNMLFLKGGQTLLTDLLNPMTTQKGKLM